MFNQVKILDAKGKVKKILSPKSLSQRYWGDFFNKNIKARNRKIKGKVRQPGKRGNNLGYDDIYFSED